VSAVRFVFCRAGGEPAVELDVDDVPAAIADAETALSRQ
jgi:hypothetical protein